MTKKYSCSPEDFPAFGKISKEVSKLRYDNLKKLLGFKFDNVEMSPECMIKIIDLVERRRVYFHIYHNIEMSEYNEIALYCFWITKLKPFKVIPEAYKITAPDYVFNAYVSVKLLCIVVARIRKHEGKNKITINIENLIHSLCYRDLSKECIMGIIAGLVEK